MKFKSLNELIKFSQNMAKKGFKVWINSKGEIRALYSPKKLKGGENDE